MPKHVVRLILLLVGFGLLAVAARNVLVDKSFYRYGHYRGDAVAEIARDKPKFQGAAYCQSCHAAQFAQWSSSGHDRTDLGKIVKCEVCHGPGGGRDPAAGYVNAATGPLHPANLKLAIPTDTRALCTVCHEKMPGRPLQQLQIVIDDHAGTQQCSLCHNSHSPRTIYGAPAPAAQAGDPAAGKTKIELCASCHGETGVSADLPGPTLAGQNAAYLAAAVEAYKTGERSNPMMTPVAGAVEQSDIPDIAAYFASLKCDSPLNGADRLAAAREAGALVCTNCHGANGISGARSAPNLVGQTKDYLANTLQAYASGARSNVIMSALTKGMSDADTEKLAAFYASASCK